MTKVVVLDPGHGGIDQDGKYTTAPKKMHTFDDDEVAYEGVINRAITKAVGQCLKDAPNIAIIYTVNPDDPTDLPLYNRVSMANELDTENCIFVSIHCNASPNHNAQGFEIFTSEGQTGSDELAKDIHEAVKFSLENNNMRDRGMKEANFYVLRKTKCVAVLIECGFFDFREEFDKLKDPEVQGDLASFIATGIVNYINGKDK